MFSVLDLAPVASGATHAEALAASVELARHVERLGYHRLWVAEHHGMPGIASSAPAVLAMRLADATSTIRIGSGGVMLPNHPPLVVAEQFGTLEALHPGRIDLGIGRAPGTDPATARALRRSAGPLSAEDFPDQLLDLIGFLDGHFPADHPARGIVAIPGRGDRPAIWLLGSSGYSAQVAAHLGLPFAFAHHFSSENTLPALELYRSLFQPSATLAEPYAIVSTYVICADDDERARWLAGPAALSFLRLRTGRPGTLPTPEEAARHPYSPEERAFVESATSSRIVGGPETVRARLDELRERTGAQELMLTAMTHDPADRLRSFSLVAEAVGLTGPAEAVAVEG